MDNFGLCEMEEDLVCHDEGLCCSPQKHHLNSRIYSPPPRAGMANAATYIRLLFSGASVMVDSKDPLLLAFDVHDVIVTL